MAIYIDDQDFSKVVYSGVWPRGGSAHEYAGTVSSSTRVGDSFTVTFTGTVIAVYGTFDITSNGVVTNYTIDGAPPVQATSQAGSGDTFRQQLWRSGPLSIAEHKLVVTMAKVNVDPADPNEGTIWFDYFLVTDPTITSTISINPTPTSSQGTRAHTGAPTGAIVGGVIGGLFFLLGLVFAILLYLRGRRPPPTEKEEKGEHSIQPFTLNLPRDFSSGSSLTTSISQFDPALLVSGPRHTSRKSTRPTAVPPRPATGEIARTSRQMESAGTSTHVESTPVELTPDLSRPKARRQVQVDVEALPQPERSSLQNPESAQPRQHVDSGVRAPGLPVLEHNVQPVELPPVYSPV